MCGQLRPVRITLRMIRTERACRGELEVAIGDQVQLRQRLLSAGLLQAHHLALRHHPEALKHIHHARHCHVAEVVHRTVVALVAVDIRSVLLVTHRPHAHLLQRRDLHHQRVARLLEVVYRVAVPGQAARLPLLAPAVELPALQTQPQILRQFAVRTAHRLHVHRRAWRGACERRAVRARLQILRLPCGELGFLFGCGVEQQAVAQLSVLCVSVWRVTYRAGRFELLITGRAIDPDVGLTGRGGVLVATFYAYAEGGEWLRFGGLYCVVEETKEEMMSCLLAVKESVLLRPCTKAEEACETHVDTLIVLLDVKWPPIHYPSIKAVHALFLIDECRRCKLTILYVSCESQHEQKESNARKEKANELLPHCL